jgi:hypothetical protein
VRHDALHQHQLLTALALHARVPFDVRKLDALVGLDDANCGAEGRRAS